jgi:hypothetical protein
MESDRKPFTSHRFLLLLLIVLCACQETLEERGAREANDYTRKHCPTSVGESIRMDSMTFDVSTHTFSYCYTLSGAIDDSTVIHQGDPRTLLLQQLRNSANLRLYKEAGYSFRYVYYSSRRPGHLLFDTVFDRKDYK